jgi:hypothetical protein
MTNLYLMLGVPTDEGERLVRCEGHVTWARMDGERCVFGVKFEHIADEDQAVFLAYINGLDNEPPPPRA